MSKIIAFSGSNSSSSINSKLINYVASIKESVDIIDLRDFEPVMYSSDLEKDYGTHPKIKQLVSKFAEADSIIVSTPEHNSMPPAFFKNILDWLSRTGVTYLDGTKYLENKKAVVMSASPGKGGAKGAQDLVGKMLGYGGAEIIGTFSLPGFNDNFKEGAIINAELNAELKKTLDLI